ncbi:MAG: hypothetical protein JW825_03660 [Candidatus Methanofastidiosa archaeon]|nr:hypothetical protein [Candidatus Methanofastidiosa archaeon]
MVPSFEGKEDKDQVEIILVLPKNAGLKEYTQIFLERYPELKDHKVIEVRGEDVPFWIGQLTIKGKRALGLTGEDLYNEYKIANPEEDIIEVLDKIEWMDPKALFMKPALCLIGPEGKTIDDLPKEMTICSSKKYRSIVRKYLERYRDNGYTIDEIYVNGSVETSCSEGISDVAIDIVYSGKSMKECGLCIYDIIFKSDCVVLGGKSNDRT